MKYGDWEKTNQVFCILSDILDGVKQWPFKTCLLKLFLVSNIWPALQSGRAQPAGHVQFHSPILSLHVPLLWHGLLAHSSISVLKKKIIKCMICSKLSTKINSTFSFVNTSYVLQKKNKAVGWTCIAFCAIVSIFANALIVTNVFQAVGTVITRTTGTFNNFWNIMENCFALIFCKGLLSMSNRDQY